MLIPIQITEPEKPSSIEESGAEPGSYANSLKRRLLGAAVLIALAVIFLPLLLDGSGSESSFRRVEKVREQPPRIIGADGQPELRSVTAPRPTTPKPEPKPTPKATQTAEPQNPQPQVPVAKPSDGTTVIVERSEAPRQPAQPEPAVVPPVAQETVALNNPSAAIDAALLQIGERLPDAGGSIASPSAGVANPELAAARSRSTGGGDQTLVAWVIQAGSFKDAANAERLRDSLRDRGFPSFVSASGDRDLPETLRFRVKVGPMADRINVQQRKREIERITGRESLVREYRP